MVIEPSPLPIARQAQHNTEVANPWILTKKKKTSTEQIINQSTVTSLAEKTKYNLYRAKATQTPLPNTAIQICLSKKKKTQYRENQTPDPEQTKPTVRRSTRSMPLSLAGAAHSMPLSLVVLV